MAVRRFGSATPALRQGSGAASILESIWAFFPSALRSVLSRR